MLALIQRCGKYIIPYKSVLPVPSSFVCSPQFQVLCVRKKIIFRMVDAKLEAVPVVDIDPEGIFKYILIKVYGKEKSDGSEPSKLIVRGYARAKWHNDIYDEVSSSIQGLGLGTECLGGGRIEHRPDQKKLKVYGYSQGYGKADHAETRNILKTKYTDYEIEISDEGY